MCCETTIKNRTTVETVVPRKGRLRSPNPRPPGRGHHVGARISRTWRSLDRMLVASAFGSICLGLASFPESTTGSVDSCQTRCARRSDPGERSLTGLLGLHCQIMSELRCLGTSRRRTTQQAASQSSCCVASFHGSWRRPRPTGSMAKLVLATGMRSRAAGFIIATGRSNSHRSGIWKSSTCWRRLYSTRCITCPELPQFLARLSASAPNP